MLRCPGLPALLLLPLVWLLSGCPWLAPAVAPLAAPVITADAPTLNAAGSSLTFIATISIDEHVYAIRRVYVSWGRYGLAPSRFGVATRTSNSNVWTVSDMTSPPAYAPSAPVRFIWGIDYGVVGGQEHANKETAEMETRVGCSSTATALTLAAEQAAVMARWGGVTNPQLHPQLLPTHGYLSFAGVGVAFLIDGSPATATAGSPALLLFAPSSPAPAIPDPPYTLIGWAYTSPYVPDAEPVLGCIPRENWFIHEAGYHPPNGGFAPAPPAEATPGAAAGGVPPVFGFPPPPLGVPHGRFWDLHLFATPSGTAAIGVPDTTGNAGSNPAGIPATGAPFPGGSFFFPARIP